MNNGRDEALHPIGVAAERAGISPDVVRAWERRYGVVEPARDDAGRRVYTSADVRRLRLLAQATEGGRSIGQVANLPTPDLADLVREDETARRRVASTPSRNGLPDDLVERALARVRALDGPGLDALLVRTASLQGVPALLRDVLAPLFRAIGDAWHAGELTSAQEHLASATTRGALGRLLANLSAPAEAPVLVVGTPAGDRHEIGALLAAAAATLEGWRVVYLGPDLPAADIAGAVRETGATAVALSVVFAPAPAALAAEIKELRSVLPDAVGILVGGGAAPALAPLMEATPGVGFVAELDDLRAHLAAALAS